MSLVFRARDEPVKTRLDYWRHVMSGLCGPLELRADADAPEHPAVRDQLVVGALGPVRVGDLSVERPGQADRTKRHASRLELDLCKIGVQTGGRSVVEQHGRQAVLDPGDLVLLDLAHPSRFVTGPSRITEVAFPRTLLQLPADDLARATAVRIPGDQGPAALVSSLGRDLPAQLAAADGAHAARLGTAVLDLFTGSTRLSGEIGFGVVAVWGGVAR